MRTTVTEIRKEASDISIQRESKRNVSQLQEFYQRQGYAGTISADAILISARTREDVIGLVRLVQEESICVLRGMNVDIAWQRRGVGRRMLRYLAHQLEAPCFCIPHGWLEAFYGSIGFVRLPDNTAPRHLSIRLEDYRRRGEQPIFMFRPLARVELL